MNLDWTTLLLEVLNFLVLVWILKRFLYQPVLDVLDARQARVKEEMSQAKEAQQEGAALRQDYEDRLGSWAQEREKLRQKLEQELEQQRVSGMDRIRQSLADEDAKARARSAATTAANEARLIHEATGAAYGNVAAMLQRLASPELTSGIAGLLVEDLADLPSEQLVALRAAAAKLGPEGTAEIAAAHPLADATVKKIERALGTAAGQRLAVAVTIEPALIAGLRIAVGESLLHASLGDELTFFERQDGHA